MPDLFDEAPEAAEGEFSLPGDDQLLAATTAGQELAQEEAAPEPDPVSEAGRLLRAQRDKSEEPVAEATEETTEDAELIQESEASPVDALLAKYGGDVDKALAAAAEAQSLLGRQAQELGEARQAAEQWAEWAQYQEQLAQQQQQQQSQGTQGWEELIDEDPARATQLAFEQGNAAAYQAAATAWDELNPGAPQNWYDNQQIKAVIAQQHQQQQFAQQEAVGKQAITQIIERHPDLADYVDKMTEIAPQYPHEVAALASGNLNVIAPALESLYFKARGLTSDTLTSTAEQLARKQTEEEMRVRQEASVATASRTGIEPPVSDEDIIAAGWANDDKLNEGWNLGQAAS